MCLSEIVKHGFHYGDNAFNANDVGHPENTVPLPVNDGERFLDALHAAHPLQQHLARFVEHGRQQAYAYIPVAFIDPVRPVIDKLGENFHPVVHLFRCVHALYHLENPGIGMRYGKIEADAALFMNEVSRQFADNDGRAVGSDDGIGFQDFIQYFKDIFSNRSAAASRF